MVSKYDDDRELSDKLNEIENYYADTVLSEGLKELYAQVQLNCEYFRENVFFKNVDDIESKVGFLDRKPRPHHVSSKSSGELLHDFKLVPELMKIYENKSHDVYS